MTEYTISELQDYTIMWKDWHGADLSEIPLTRQLESAIPALIRSLETLNADEIQIKVPKYQRPAYGDTNYADTLRLRKVPADDPYRNFDYRLDQQPVDFTGFIVSKYGPQERVDNLRAGIIGDDGKSLERLAQGMRAMSLGSLR